MKKHILKILKKTIPRELGNAGFSLVEMLVVLAISSIIIVIIYGGHRSITTSVHRWIGIADFYENVNLAISRMERDLSSIHYNKKTRKVHFIGESGYESPYNAKFNFVCVDHNELSMLANMDMPFPKSDVREVGYFLEPDEQIPDLFYLMRREQNHYDEEQEEGGETNILLENVVDLKFEFKTKFSRDWSNTIDSRTAYKLPRAIKTTLIVRNYQEQDVEFHFLTLINRL